MSRGRLTDEQVHELADELALGAISRCERQAQPVAALLAGQSGAGKSHVGAGIQESFVPRGGCVVVDADLVRPALPYSASNSAETQADAGRIAEEILRRAVAASRNVVVHGTLRNPDAALEAAQGLRGAGYRVELHALAVNEQISHMRAVQREQRQVEAGVPPRVVPAAWHDESYRGSAASVRRLEYAGAVDRVVVYNRLGDTVHDAAPTPGQTPAGTLLDQSRSRLTDYERVHLAREWDAIVEGMEQRGADAASVVRANVAADRAHYTLRASPAAASSYDDMDPANRLASIERASKYGARLVDAYRSGDKAQAQVMPELAPAFVAEAAASRLLEQRGRAAGPAFDAVRDRIANGLQRGVELAPVQLREQAAPVVQAAATR